MGFSPDKSAGTFPYVARNGCAAAPDQASVRLLFLPCNRYRGMSWHARLSCNSFHPIPPIEASRTRGEESPRPCSLLVSRLPRNLQGFSSFYLLYPERASGALLASIFEKQDVNIVRRSLIDDWAIIKAHAAALDTSLGQTCIFGPWRTPKEPSAGSLDQGQDEIDAGFSGKEPRKAPQQRFQASENPDRRPDQARC